VLRQAFKQQTPTSDALTIDVYCPEVSDGHQNIFRCDTGARLAAAVEFFPSAPLSVGYTTLEHVPAHGGSPHYCGHPITF